MALLSALLFSLYHFENCCGYPERFLYQAYPLIPYDYVLQNGWHRVQKFLFETVFAAYVFSGYALFPALLFSFCFSENCPVCPISHHCPVYIPTSGHYVQKFLLSPAFGLSPEYPHNQLLGIWHLFFFGSLHFVLFCLVSSPVPFLSCQLK
nr:hypothetical protein [uncultured Schaedlerella sp.]